MRNFILLFCLLTLFSGLTNGQKKDTKKLKWWQEARFGMFIHWGPVSRIGKEISWSREGFAGIKEFQLFADAIKYTITI